MQMSKFRDNLQEHWLEWLVFTLLILFPFIVQWITGDSPFGVARGDRMMMRGQSVLWQSILIRVFSLAILVMSYNLMFGFTGVISFGHALFFGLGGYILGMIAELSGLNANLALFLSVIVVLIVNGILGFIIGIVSLRLRGVYFAIFTLAVAEMAWLFFRGFGPTNGEDGLNIVNLPLWIDPSRNRITVYYIGMFLFVMTYVIIKHLVNSPAGTVFQAIRENEERAQAIGYNTLQYKSLSITIAGMLASLGGMLYAILDKAARPEILGVGITVDALLMTIIGGVGTFIGPVVGSTSLHILDVIFRDAVFQIGTFEINIGERWLLILGFIFILVVLVFPYGMVGTWQRLQQKLFKKSE